MLSNLINAVTSGDATSLKYSLAVLLLSLPIVFLALCVHELAHGYVAYKLGDPTAKNLGRLTLNPLKHLDPFGFICMVLFGYGWAKPVPINTRYFKKPARDMAICAAVGPLSNLAMSLMFTVLLKLLLVLRSHLPVGNEVISNVLFFTEVLFSCGIIINLCYAVFNLIPIPPLDGSKILYHYLPTNVLMWVIQRERYISLILMVLIFVGVIGKILNFIVVPLIDLLALIFNIPTVDIYLYNIISSIAEVL